MNSSLLIACFAASLALSSAHLCLLNPHQRGSMADLNKKGSDDCILLKGPCGGRPSSTPVTNLIAGMKNTVIFQKNLDHWVKKTPGYFNLTLILENKNMKKKEVYIAQVPDKGEPSLTLYTVTGVVPSGLSGPAVLQVTYVTNNPAAPPVFYQCADVTIKDTIKDLDIKLKTYL